MSNFGDTGNTSFRTKLIIAKDGPMLKSLLKKKPKAPNAEEILALSAARAALVDRMDGMLSRIPTVVYVQEPCPIYDAPQEEEAQAA